MLTRFTWIVTALLLVGGCLYSVWKGLEIVSYARAGAEAEAVLPWLAVPGLSFRAREYALTSTDNSSDEATIRKWRDELIEILAVRPLSSFYWLQLAESYVDAKDASTKTSTAFELSMLTGRNEGYMITQRGMFGIWRWEMLSAEDQNSAVTDLVTRRLSDEAAVWMKKTLSEKPPSVQQAIKMALQAQGFAKSEFVRIGL